MVEIEPAVERRNATGANKQTNKSVFRTNCQQVSIRSSNLFRFPFLVSELVCMSFTNESLVCSALSCGVLVVCGVLALLSGRRLVFKCGELFVFVRVSSCCLLLEDDAETCGSHYKKRSTAPLLTTGIHSPRRNPFLARSFVLGLCQHVLVCRLLLPAACLLLLCSLGKELQGRRSSPSLILHLTCLPPDDQGTNPA